MTWFPTDPAEWKGAREVKVEGMRVRLGRRGDVLAVAVELDAPGAGGWLAVQSQRDTHCE